MFWSGNYIAVRELNFLLKEENVSLSQVLEADDILQECKADNKALIQFLTKPEVLAELITLITEEPPKNVELASQYRHASIACEVLTSQLSTLSDRLSLDTVQMNRLCDFINKEPPLNPLLASYFSKTVEMLLERSPKQDWYLYHIVCLRVLDFFKSRRDFLPNLLRHLHTSAVADTFKYFIRLDDLFNKIVMEWLDEHQFLECLIQIICGTYVPEPIRPAAEVAAAGPGPGVAVAGPGSGPGPGPGPADSSEAEKADNELSEKPELNHKQDGENTNEETPIANNINEIQPAEEDKPAIKANGGGEQPSPSRDEPELAAAKMPGTEDQMARDRVERMKAVAAANAAALLCDLIVNGCAPDGCSTRARTVWAVVWRLQSERWVRALLAAVFTSPGRARHTAVVRAAQILLALLSCDPVLPGQCGAERTSVELAVAPHLPLLHQALLQDPDADVEDEPKPHDKESKGGCDAKRKTRVGAARIHVAALLAHLALSEVEDVPTTMITLGTPGTLVELFFSHPDNNFLHAQVYTLIKHALQNRAYRTQYANHLIVECDLLTRLMDAYEDNENKTEGRPRAGYMGHVILTLRRVAAALREQDGALLAALSPAPRPALLARWAAFQHTLQAALHHHDTPLGGYYPSDNTYEADNMTEMADCMETSYEFNDIVGGEMSDLGDDMNLESVQEVAEPADCGDGGEGGEDKVSVLGAKNTFLELASQRFDDDMWDDSPEMEDLSVSRAAPHDVRDVLAAVSPWESNEAGSSGGEGAGGGEDWAQFTAAAAPPPADPFAALRGPDPADPYAALRGPDPADPYAALRGPDPAEEFKMRKTIKAKSSPFIKTDSAAQQQDLDDTVRKLHLYSTAMDSNSLPENSDIADSAENTKLANNLLSAMSGMTPDLIANIVNANMPDTSPEPPPLPGNVESTVSNASDNSAPVESNSSSADSEAKSEAPETPQDSRDS